jgi:hypothetical protein
MALSMKKRKKKKKRTIIFYGMPLGRTINYVEIYFNDILESYLN